MNKELSDFATRLSGAISCGEHCFVNAPISQGSDEALPSKFGEPDFNALALELFALQFEYNAVYRKICESRGVTPGVIEDWTQIPAVPTAAFKELELTCIPPEERTAVFHSSGTTEQKPSRHFHSVESLNVYETSLLPWFQANVLANSKFKIQNSQLIVLAPPPEQAPHSSLVHMFETVRRKLVTAQSVFGGKVGPDGTWTLDFDAALAALNSSLVTRHPLLILGTAFSFVHLLDDLGDRNLQFRLPPGSRVMETGGYKNRSRTMPKKELHTLITERLGILPENIICEYGMSELSSQAYDSVASGGWRVAEEDGASCHPSPVTCRFSFPPWARAQIISPETGCEVADGETGLLRVFDLANVFSVMAVQTEDLAVRRGDGFELIGRAQAAEARGCSLMTMEGSASSLP
jgi:Acyl-protein synthetase, LuxE